MAQRGLGFNFLYITAWFNLTWDLLWGPVLDQTEIRNVAMQCGNSYLNTFLILILKWSDYRLHSGKFKCCLMKIWTIGKSKCHLPAAKSSDLRVADLPDWYNFIRRPLPPPTTTKKKKHFQCSATPTHCDRKNFWCKKVIKSNGKR